MPATDRPSDPVVDLWHHPLVRSCAAALRDIYHETWPSEHDSLVSEEDVTRWAHQFAASSYGDELFATSLAIFLQPAAPSILQVFLESSEQPHFKVMSPTAVT